MSITAACAAPVKDAEPAIATTAIKRRRFPAVLNIESPFVDGVSKGTPVALPGLVGCAPTWRAHAQPFARASSVNADMPKLTVTALLDDGPLKGDRVEVDMLEGRPPMTSTSLPAMTTASAATASTPSFRAAIRLSTRSSIASEPRIPSRVMR